MLLHAYAKLNLALQVLNKRSDSYHNMDMLMQSVSLYDAIFLEKTPQGIILECSIPDLGAVEENIACRAAEQFFRFTGLIGGVSIKLEKNIPFQAGLAGGSADAAAVLVGLNALYRANLSGEELCALGIALGSDVPFCLIGGTAHVQGKGERVELLPALQGCTFLIVKPQVGISTGVAFSAVDHAKNLKKVMVNKAVQAAVNGNLTQVCRAMGNTFEQVTVLEEVFALKEELLQLGALGALMSGSGSAVFGVFRSESEAKQAAEKLSGDYDGVFLAKPMRQGMEIIDTSN